MLEGRSSKLLKARSAARGVAAVMVLLALLLVACGGDDGNNTSSTTPAPTEAEATPPSRTGVQDIDAIIEAVLTRDAEALRSLVRLRPLACIGPTPSSLGALFCENAETEGTIIDVLPVAQCESHYTRHEELDQVLLFESTIDLYAVHKAGDQYSAVFTQQPDAEGPLFGVTVGIDRGLINYIDYGCGQTAEQLVANVAEEDFLIAPREGAPLTPAR